jgi:hypothetical protein
MREGRGGLSPDPRTKLLILVLINPVTFTCPDLYTGWLCVALIALELSAAFAALSLVTALGGIGILYG